MRITRDFFFVDLRKKLNSLTCRFFTSKLSIWITIHDAIKSQAICLTKIEGLLPLNSLFLMNRTQQKTPRPGQTINKSVTNQNHTEPSRTKTVIWNWAMCCHLPYYLAIKLPKLRKHTKCPSSNLHSNGVKKQRTEENKVILVFGLICRMMFRSTAKFLVLCFKF